MYNYELSENNLNEILTTELSDKEREPIIKMLDWIIENEIKMNNER